MLLFVLEGWETGTEITEAKDFSFTLVWRRKKTEFVLYSTIFCLHQNSNFLCKKAKKNCKKNQTLPISAQLIKSSPVMITL